MKLARCGTEIEPDRYATAGNKATIIFIENDHDMNQWFKYKCLNFKNAVANGKS